MCVEAIACCHALNCCHSMPWNMDCCRATPAQQVHGTAFGEPTGTAMRVEAMSDMLVQHGFSYSGKDFLTSGITGGRGRCRDECGAVLV